MKITEGQRLPVGYGFAWRNYSTLTAEVFLIPFNFLARWMRDLYYFLAKPPKTRENAAWLGGYAQAQEHYEHLLKAKDEEWSRTLGLAILNERGIK